MESRSQRLCRLCEFPTADGGVPLDALDADKWAAWCRRELGEELYISTDHQAAQRMIICQFCIWEARIAHESSLNEWSENENGCDWWTGHDDDHFFREYFYKKPVMGPCKVVLKKISSDFEHLLLEDIDCSRSNAHLEAKTQACQTSNQVEKESDIKSAASKSTRIFQCSICSVIFHNNYYFLKHIKLIHKNKVRCRSLFCPTYFLTDGERLQHEQKFHLNSAINEMVRCIYCGALVTVEKLYTHIKLHKEAIKCDYNKTCPNYFHTESEKNEHIFNEHTGGLKHKSTPMKCIYCDKICKNKFKLVEHVSYWHKYVRINCRVYGCGVYFLSKKDSEEHFLQVHQHAESLKKWQCPKCSYVASQKRSLQSHLKRIHVNKDSTSRSLKCPQCPKYFPAELNLKDHIKSIHAGRCTCQYCGKTMLKSSMLAHYLGGACKPIPI